MLLSPAEAESVPSTRSPLSTDFVMTLITPPNDEPHVEEVGPLMTSIFLTICTGNVASWKSLLAVFSGTPSSRTATLSLPDP